MVLLIRNLTLVAFISVGSLAATIASHPAKAVRWVTVPRTLQDIKHNIRDEKDLFKRQVECPPTDAVCGNAGCCSSGFACINTGGADACCPVGETCSGPPVGCANPSTFECPASIGGCCPNGQECYQESGGTGCRATTTSLTPGPVTATAVPIYITTTARPIYYSTRDPESNPTYLDPGVTTVRPTGGETVVGTSPRTTTTGNGVEKSMRIDLGLLGLMIGVFSVLF